MSRSITVGADPADRDGKFSVPSGIGDVKASGHLSNQVTVGRDASGPPADPPAGPVETRRTVTGATVVKAGGVEMSLEEAKSLGIVDGDGRPTEKATDAPPVESKPDKASGDGGDDGSDPDTEFPTVNRAELDSHIAEINAVGDALTSAGIDAEDALARSVESARATGELPDDVSEALIARFGDDADAIADNVNYHVAALTIDAMRDMGLSLTPEVAAAYDKFVSDRSDMVSAIVAAIRGQPGMLRQIVTEFAASRRR